MTRSPVKLETQRTLIALNGRQLRAPSAAQAVRKRLRSRWRSLVALGDMHVTELWWTRALLREIISLEGNQARPRRPWVRFRSSNIKSNLHPSARVSLCQYFFLWFCCQFLSFVSFELNSVMRGVSVAKRKYLYSWWSSSNMASNVGQRLTMFRGEAHSFTSRSFNLPLSFSLHF